MTDLLVLHEPIMSQVNQLDTQYFHDCLQF